MKKLMDKLIMLFKTSKNYKVFFLSIVIVSITFGAVFSILINNSDKIIVTNYLSNYFNQITANKIVFLDLFINNSVSYLLIILLMWILGISIIGLPINIFIVFSKMFGIGFSIGSIILNYKIKGILLSLLYIIPCQIIYIFAFYLLLFYACNLSIKLLFTLLKKKNIDFKLISNKYLRILFITLIIIIINSLLSSLINIYLLNFLLTFIK